MNNLHSLVADKIEHDPGCIRQAAETLKQWASHGFCPDQRCQEWAQLLRHADEDDKGLQCLLNLLRSDDEGARRMQDFSPFAGVLTRDERRKAYLSCAYDH